MQSIIISSKDKQKGEEYAVHFCGKEGISHIDTTIVRFEKDLESSKQSIGILEIRTILQKIFLKPIKGDKKAVVIFDAHLLTTEAQNALLKVLEEPPVSTTIILVTIKTEALLPTISSRCVVIELKTALTSLDEKEHEGLMKIISQLLIPSSKNALRLAQDIGTQRSEVIIWLEKAIQTARKQLIDEVSGQQSDNRTIEQLVGLLKSLQKNHLLIQTTNVNPRLILENLFLGNS